MNKFKIFYLIIIILCIIMIFTKGFNINITAFSYGNVPFAYDGYSGHLSLLIVNIIIVSMIIISTIVITLLKSNKLKGKWLLFASIIILLLFVPIATNYYSGGITGKKVENNEYLWSIFFDVYLLKK